MDFELTWTATVTGTQVWPKESEEFQTQWQTVSGQCSISDTVCLGPLDGALVSPLEPLIPPSH